MRVRLSAFDGQVTSSDDVTVVVARAGGLGHRPAGAVLQRRGQRRLLHGARADAHRSHGRLRLGQRVARSCRAGRQFLGPLERAGPGAGDRHLHVHDDIGRRRPAVRERSAAGRQLDRSRGDSEQRHHRADAGQRYDIRMDYYDHGQLATAQAVMGVPGPDDSGRAAVGAVSRSAGQSAADGRRGRGQDDHASVRCEPERHRARRRLARPGADDDVEQDQRARGFGRRDRHLRESRTRRPRRRRSAPTASTCCA